MNPMSMEWHFGNNFGDFAVPKDEEIFNWFPSPNSWLTRGKKVGNFDYPENLTVSEIEEFLHAGSAFSREVEQLTAPNVDQDSRHAFLEWNASPHEHSDPQLSDIALINEEADDIFFRSLFEDPAEIDGDESSSKFTWDSSKDNVISVNLSGEWNHIQDSANPESCGPPPEKFEEPESGTHMAEEHSNEHEDRFEDISMEESVLLELQRSTLQLTKKTRLCFRDSLYRLAENSRQNTKQNRNGKVATKNCKPHSKGSFSRLRQQSKLQEPGTNAVDRTVATLLFNILEREIYQTSSDLFQPASSVSPCPGTLFMHDAEAPNVAFARPGLPFGFHYNHSSMQS
ncbi:protein LNK3 [Andrographis paniculata]|uniref:protein LNK3 n=1 Tax=Andrographis paniculata TaxID=175694 RepID=UPI0021E7C824|nr:protein LNK3 [Andrographis paniculata]